MTTFRVIKRNKRLFIVIASDQSLFYVPPDFIKLPSRAPLQELCDALNELAAKLPTAQDVRRLLIAFESRWNPRRSKIV